MQHSTNVLPYKVKNDRLRVYCQSVLGKEYFLLLRAEATNRPHALGSSTAIYKSSPIPSPYERIPRASCSRANLISNEANTFPKTVLGCQPLYHLA